MRAERQLKNNERKDIIRAAKELFYPASVIAELEREQDVDKMRMIMRCARLA